jgi:hypothetical protein
MSKLVDSSLEILKILHAPSNLLNERSALVLIALVGLGPNDDFKKATNKRLSIVGNKKEKGYPGIMQFLKLAYGKDYAENSRETFRRVDIHTMIQLGIVEKNADDKSIPTNSSKNHYSLIPEFVNVLRVFGKRSFQGKLKEFIDDSEVRNRRYKKQEELQEIEVTLPNGKLVKFSPGDHNELQGRIIDAFLSIFAPGSEVLYVGDTTDKYLVLDEDKLTELGLDLSKTSHTKLPDVVLFDKKRNWVFFIEAVTSHGPIGDKRMHSLEKMTSKLKAGSVFVTAFLNRKDFRKFSADIAWESEVWIAENPNHMIHFNGDRFMGPRK